jgi:hypothetical protein
MDAIRGADLMLADMSYQCTILLADYVGAKMRVDFSAIGVGGQLDLRGLRVD